MRRGIQINGKVIPEVNEHTYLGIKITRELCLKKMIADRIELVIEAYHGIWPVLLIEFREWK